MVIVSPFSIMLVLHFDLLFESCCKLTGRTLDQVSQKLTMIFFGAKASKQALLIKKNKASEYGSMKKIYVKDNDRVFKVGCVISNIMLISMGRYR